MTDAPLEENQPFNEARLEAMNAKTLENQFFTPDHVYVDLSLMKDFPLGAMYADILQHRGEEHFNAFQNDAMKVISDYQKRRFDTIDPYFGKFGYTDTSIDNLLSILSHDHVFAVSPTTSFFNTLIRHTVRNQNNSGPANKFVKKQLDRTHFTLEAMPVTYYLNTYPLTLSQGFMEQLAPELGEAFGVNVRFINKDPALFDQTDWDDWLGKIECFYLNSLGRISLSPFFIQKQGDMEFCGKYFFARKRFEKNVQSLMVGQDFTHQIQLIMARISILCDFEWLMNNDTRLTEDEDPNSGDADTPTLNNGIPS